ncbi:hypothetical protein Pla22_26840 [Rubripirellula amarantea]|uniref:Uncharacterized protein n=1 Tax=Rubripirellula amarantea TaxID=2527999 RepID=A0A5C5WWW0_9BACT|nr:hypothetical protein [Rubripirellula amarantea]TWT55030.1 hypothetical protein Pla22_26840 [Rubripirellula amarantea]
MTVQIEMLSRKLEAVSVVKWLFVRMLMNVAIVSTTVSFADAGIFFIGNSLTWDARPMLFDQPTDWHIRSGRNLPYILDHPSELNGTDSTSWDVGLVDHQYDWLVIQPHFRSTLQEDVDAISHWMQLQPNAKVLLHTGWARHAEIATIYEGGNVNDVMSHSPEYFDDLMSELAATDPGREISRTKHMDVLYEVKKDIEAGIAPIDEFSDLFRDSLHLTIFEGRYLAHNLLRNAVGEPTSTTGFVTQRGDLKFSQATKDYFDTKLLAVLLEDVPATVPEMSTFFSFVLIGCLALWNRFPRRNIRNRV